MSNIAPYNGGKKRKKKKRGGGGGGGKPIMNRNEMQTETHTHTEMQTETRERKKSNKKNKKSTHVADSVTVSMSGVFSLSFVSATVLHSGHTDLAITH